MTEPLKYHDRTYRSGSAFAAGVLLLGLAGWLGGDAAVRGDGRTPVVAVCTLLFVVPLVIAFTMRPAVFAGDERLRVRNPFRTITVPWGAVESIQARYSCELVVADSARYQLWAIPVSLRARSRAQRHNERLAAGESPRPRAPFSLSGFGGVTPEEARERTAPSDAAVAELRELAERHGGKEPAQGSVAVRWSYEILAPLAAGAVALAALWLTA
jgi:hypothetical protein